MPESFGFVVGVASVWVFIGVVLSLVMGRRGYYRFSWLVLGALLGPLAIVLALDSWRHHEQLAPTVLVEAPAARSSGTVDVLVGHDGSPEAAAVVEAAVELLGPRLGRLTLATVVPFDVGARSESLAAAALRRVADMPQTPSAELEILHGRPAEALQRRAIEGHYDLLTIGIRGDGVAKAMLGRTATELARGSKVPVLMVGSPTAHRA